MQTSYQIMEQELRKFFHENSFNKYPRIELNNFISGTTKMAKCEFRHYIQSLSSNLNMLDSKTQLNLGTSAKH